MEYASRHEVHGRAAIFALSLQHEDLGRAVPARRHVVGVLSHVGDVKGCLLAAQADGVIQSSAAREPKVGHLHQALGVEQQVGRLQVAVHELPAECMYLSALNAGKQQLVQDEHCLCTILEDVRGHG